jgi:hypothetical protein
VAAWGRPTFRFFFVQTSENSAFILSCYCLSSPRNVRDEISQATSGCRRKNHVASRKFRPQAAEQLRSIINPVGHARSNISLNRKTLLLLHPNDQISTAPFRGSNERRRHPDEKIHPSMRLRCSRNRVCRYSRVHVASASHGYKHEAPSSSSVCILYLVYAGQGRRLFFFIYLAFGP